MTNQSVTKKRVRRPDARPGEILLAALSLFSEKGFAATRMEDVARGAGLSKGAIYLYFPDKVSLLRAVVQETADSIIGMAHAIIATHQGPIAPLFSALLGSVAEKVDTTNIAFVIKLVVSEGRAHPEIGRAYLENLIGRAFPLMEGLVTRGVASGEFRPVNAAMTVRSFIAPMLLAAIWKSIFEPLGAEPLSARALAAHHVELILRGLKP